MRKLIMMLLVLAGGISTVSARTIYLYPNVWRVGTSENETFGVWEYDSQDNGTLHKLDLMANNTYYSADISDDAVKINFVRYDGSIDFDWNSNKWNQTNDFSITPASTALLYMIEGWHIDNNEANNSSCCQISVTIKGTFDSWGNGLALNIDDDVKFTGSLDTSNSNGIKFKAVINGNDYLGASDTEKLTLSAEDGLVSDDGTNDHNFSLLTVYNTCTFTATWTPSYYWWKGWTLEVTGSTPKTVNVSAGANGKATFSSAYPLDFSSTTNIRAYSISSLAKTAATLMRVNTKVPAETGLLIMGEPNAYDVIPAVASAEDIGTNYLQAAVTAYLVENAGDAYILSSGKFVKSEAGNIPAGKAYLKASDIPTEARSLSLVFGDEATGIQSVDKAANENVFYNLAGQRVTAPANGLFIMNGKKIIVK